MNNTNIHNESLEGMYNGVHRAREVVARTMGAAGKNVTIKIKQYPYHLVTNDGATCIEHMWFEDPVESEGLEFLKEVVGRSNKNAGDGSTTTTVLVDAIIKHGMEHNGIEVKRSLDECISFVEESINKQKRMITADDYDKLAQVATISCEDSDMGSLLAEIYGKIGSTGIIEPEYVLGKEGTLSFDKNCYFINGIRFANFCGLLSTEMVHDEEAIKENRKEKRAVYENPIILVTKRKITNIREIDPIIMLAKKREKDLVIFADDMDSQVAQVIIANHKLRKEGIRLDLPRITIIKAPTVWKEFVYEDFSKCTGATVVCDPTGVNFKNLSEAHLGTCEKIIIEGGETRIIGTKDISGHIAELQAVVDSGNDSNDDALRRIGWLTAKTVLLKVGGLSETEITYKRLKLEDAINATRSALSDGIVAGGGISLLNVALSLNPTESIGKAILYEALQEPFRQIVKNARVEVEGWMRTPFSNEGFDAKTKKVVDMFESGIIDSAKISLNAVKNAIGIASTILTSDTFIDLPPEKETQQMMMPGMPMM